MFERVLVHFWLFQDAIFRVYHFFIPLPLKKQLWEVQQPNMFLAINNPNSKSYFNCSANVSFLKNFSLCFSKTFLINPYYVIILQIAYLNTCFYFTTHCGKMKVLFQKTLECFILKIIKESNYSAKNLYFDQKNELTKH